MLPEAQALRQRLDALRGLISLEHVVCGLAADSGTVYPKQTAGCPQ